ncbi:ATP-grasp domain-containing protein, partial [Microbacteriaceae bacterium K1510]|nr:ATP-grasp domain-containing protein [Microbacteriaceae bacterium K1510]
AKDTMKTAGVPTVPGTDGLIESVAEAIQTAQQIGYPVMVKATAGGGGRGMRVAVNDEDLEKAIRQAQNEAKTAFGNPGVYLEKFVEGPRHVE